MGTKELEYIWEGIARHLSTVPKEKQISSLIVMPSNQIEEIYNAALNMEEYEVCKVVSYVLESKGIIV